MFPELTGAGWALSQAVTTAAERPCTWARTRPSTISQGVRPYIPGLARYGARRMVAKPHATRLVRARF